MTNLIILSGCSGGGKSTLLKELESRGYSVVPEAGRRVVASAMAEGTNALPWVSPEAFVRACVTLHLEDLEQLPQTTQPVFLDRSAIDTITYLSFKDLPIPPDIREVLHQSRYSKLVFLTPPWPEIFETDAERQKSFEEAVLEYQNLHTSFKRLGFEIDILAQAPVGERADYIEATLETKSALLE